MISCYNGVVRRPHVPRERALRRIMRSQGIDVEVEPSPPQSRSSPKEPEEEPEDEGYNEEGEEESELADHECVEDEGHLLSVYTCHVHIRLCLSSIPL